jgi:hypothetical protein
MVYVGVTANTGDRKKINLGPNHGARNGERVVEPWITINDQREWLGNCSYRGCTRRELCMMKGRPPKCRRIGHAT